MRKPNVIGEIFDLTPGVPTFEIRGQNRITGQVYSIAIKLSGNSALTSLEETWNCHPRKIESVSHLGYHYIGMNIIHAVTNRVVTHHVAVAAVIVFDYLLALFQRTFDG